MTKSLGVRDRFLVSMAGSVGPALVRAMGASWRINVFGEDSVDAVHAGDKRVIHAFWHGQLLALEYAYRNRGICVLSSLHRDGEMSARLMSALGYEVVRGSTSRGSARGLVGMLSKLKAGRDLAITPDGPRGPARVVKPGIFYLSDRSGAPIVPVGVWSGPSRALSSWDGFTVPLPFARVVIVHGEPIEPVPGADAAERSAALGDALEELSARAASLSDE